MISSSLNFLDSINTEGGVPKLGTYVFFKICPRVLIVYQTVVLQNQGPTA